MIRLKHTLAGRRNIRLLISCLPGLHLIGCKAPDGAAPRLTLTDSITYNELGSIDGVTRINKDALAILDGSNANVVVVDATSRVLVRFGRHGSGPMEFVRPVALWVDSNDQIVVADQGKQMLSYWSVEGQLLRSVRGPARLDDVLVSPDGTAYFRISVVPPLAARVSFFRYDDDKVGNEPVAEIGASEGGSACLWCNAAIGPDEWIVLAAPGGDGYPLTAIDGEGVTAARFVRSGLEREKRSLEVRKRMAEELAAGTGRRPNVARVPEYWPAFRKRSLSIDARGRVWVVPRTSRPAGSIVDVFEWSGPERVATLEIDQRITGAFILGNEFFGIGKTEVGIPIVYVYVIEN